MTFLATGEDTQGQFALIEAVQRRGNVPPPHIHHREDEIFYLLEGELTVSVGDRTMKARAWNYGLLTTQCAALVHDRIGAGAKCSVLLTPAGFEGWFKEFRACRAPAMTLPPATEVAYEDVQRMLEAAPRYGLEFVLPERQ